MYLVCEAVKVEVMIKNSKGGLKGATTEGRTEWHCSWRWPEGAIQETARQARLCAQGTMPLTMRGWRGHSIHGDTRTGAHLEPVT